MSGKNAKICPHCGASLPQDAAFCPCCASTLVERQAMPMPRHRRRKWLFAVCLALAVIAGLALALRHPAASPAGEAANEPPVQETDPYLAACQTYYTGADGQEYRVYTAFSPQGESGTPPAGYFSALLQADRQDNRPATVFAVNATTGESAAEAFMALLKDWDVTVTASDGSGRVTLGEPDYDWSGTGALLCRTLTANGTCTHNDILWTLRMKNGDVIQLWQTVECAVQETVTFDWRETAMDTAVELQALLDDVARRYDADTKVEIILPGVTYDAPVSVLCAAEFQGSGTVFAAPVSVTALADTDRSAAYVRFDGIAFTGSGNGTGLSAAAPTYLERCRFTGWDVAAEAVDGGWVYSQWGCTFSGNGTALRLASGYTTSWGGSNNTDFTGNGTAIQIDRMPGGTWLLLDACRFAENGVDIANPYGYQEATDTCRFE